MGRERKLYRWILISATIVAASACCTIADEARTEVKVSFSGGAMSSKPMILMKSASRISV